MWVIFDHLRPSGHIMPDHAGDRGTALLVLAPHDHLHIKQSRMPAAMQAARRSPRSVAVDEIQQEVGLPPVTADTVVKAGPGQLPSVSYEQNGSSPCSRRGVPSELTEAAGLDPDDPVRHHGEGTAQNTSDGTGAQGSARRFSIRPGARLRSLPSPRRSGHGKRRSRCRLPSIPRVQAVRAVRRS
jgi:hypothetical protein